MMFKNTSKLIFSNFSVMWKTLLYSLIICLIGVGLLSPFFGLYGKAFSPIFDDALNLIGSGAFTNWNMFLSGTQSAMQAFGAGFINMFSLNVAGGIYTLIVLFLLLPFLYNLSKMALSESVYGNMSSSTKLGYFSSFLKKLGASSAYAILRTLICLPINILIFIGIYGIFTAQGTLMFVIPLFLVMFLSLILALKEMLVCGWLPAIIVFNDNIFRGFVKGLKATKRRFWQTLSSLIMIYFIIVVVNVAFGAFSFIITLPLGFVFIGIFEMVAFFHSQGMRYYVDMDTIITPRRLEEIDSISDTKYVL